MEEQEAVIGGPAANPGPPAAVQEPVREGPAAVPAGAPLRTIARPGTPFEKIRAGLARL